MTAILERNALRVHTFGRLHVRRAGDVVTGAAAQPRRLALLALLAAAGDSGLTREKLLAYLWTDTEEDRARRGLSQAVYALRQDLGTDDVFLGGREDIRLNPDMVSSDVGEFESALASNRPDLAAAHYAGSFLDGFHLPGAAEFERWVEEERADLAHRYALSLEKLARQATERGDAAEAVGWWRKLAGQDPLNARVAVGLMRALVAAGDRTGALQHARVYEVLIEQELDAPPDREVAALAGELRRAEAADASQPQSVVATAAPPASMPAPPPPTAEAPAASAPAVAESPPATVDSPRRPSPPPSKAARPSGGASAVPAPATPAPAALRDADLWRFVGGVGLLALGFALGMVARQGRQPVLSPGPAVRVAVDDRLELDPAISPDGHTIAYAADAGDRFQIFVRRREGGPAVAVSAALAGSHRRPVWSPDGTRLAFQSAGTIYVVDALGGTPRPLVRAAWQGNWVAYPTWSPDGKQLAYAENWAIYVRPADGGPGRLVTKQPAAHTLAWSPDGRWIAFVSGNPVFAYGEVPWGNATSLGNMAPSALWLAPAKGGEPISITETSALNTSPTWLPDSRGLLFVSDRDGERDVYSIRLERDGRPSGPAERLTAGLGAHTISLSADGSELAYSVFTNTSNIWSVAIPAHGTVTLADARPVTEGAQAIEGIALAPDGGSLVYDSDRGGNQDIYRMLLTGGDPVRLTSSPDDEFVTSWSADGRELALHVYQSGNRVVRVMSAEGGPGREVAKEPPNQRSAGFAPDGRRLVFTGEEHGGRRLFVVERRADGRWGQTRRLTNEESWGGRWSPDGRSIVHCRPDGLWLTAPDGSGARRLVPADSLAAPELALWSPDGRTIYYKAFDPTGRSSFWGVPAAGGAPRLLIRFDDSARPSNRAEFATDGSRLFFTIGARQSDIWAMALRSR
jgi:Tol biopolymer transport system component/DNA-binding SARP family transcriptional activator